MDAAMFSPLNVDPHWDPLQLNPIQIPKLKLQTFQSHLYIFDTIYLLKILFINGIVWWASMVYFTWNEHHHPQETSILYLIVIQVTFTASYLEEFYTLLLDASHTADCSLDSGQRWRYHSSTQQIPPLQCSRV